MTDFQAAKKAFKALAVSLAFIFALKPAHAVIIEGFTQSGDFRTVQVSDDGRLLVATSTGVAQAVFFTSTQPVNAIQQGTWTVGLSSGITIAVGTEVTVVASTAATGTQAQVSCTNVAAVILPAAATRKQAILCNQDGSSNCWVGNSGVTAGNGLLMGPGSCFSPDGPSSYVGSIFGISSGPVVDIGRFQVTP